MNKRQTVEEMDEKQRVLPLHVPGKYLTKVDWVGYDVDGGGAAKDWKERGRMTLSRPLLDGSFRFSRSASSSSKSDSADDDDIRSSSSESL